MSTQTTKPPRDEQRDEERAGIVWWQWIGLAALVAAAIVSVSLLSFVGFGFFFVPIAVGAAFIWLFVWALRRLDFRNSLSNQRATLSQRYADGQPYDRAMRRQFERPYRDIDESPPVPPLKESSKDDLGDHAP